MVELLAKIIAEYEPSDVHIVSGREIFVRQKGVLVSTGIMAEVPRVDEFFRKIVPSDLQAKFKTDDLDFAYTLGGYRLRINAYRTSSGIAFSIRIIPSQIPDLATLGECSRLSDFLGKKQGLILVTGATSQGKTTTLASFLNRLNQEKSLHLISLEDPIEYLYPKGLSLVSQRELGRDFSSFKDALKYALRQDPDIIAVGELRDKASLKMALEAAATGHLVLGTLHTGSTREALERLESMADSGETGLIRNLLSTTLLAIMSQRLLTYQAEGKRRLIPIVELLTNTPELGTIIREGRFEQVANVLEMGEDKGMTTFARSFGKVVATENLAKENFYELEEDFGDAFGRYRYRQHR